MNWLQKIRSWLGLHPHAAEDAYFADPKNWVDCSRSSNVDAISYWFDVRRSAGGGGVLAVRFHASRTEYRYRGVPLAVFTNMLAARSRGSYVHTHLKGKFGHDPARPY